MTRHAGHGFSLSYRVDAAVIADDGLLLANLEAIADIAGKKQLPSTGAKELAEVGGLMGYGVDFVQAYYRAAYSSTDQSAPTHSRPTHTT